MTLNLNEFQSKKNAIVLSPINRGDNIKLEIYNLSKRGAK